MNKSQERILSCLQKVENPLAIYLIGSRTFGLQTEDSDFDLLVVHLDYVKRLDPTNVRNDYIKQDFTKDAEVTFVELGSYLHKYNTDPADLKIVETSAMRPIWTSPLFQEAPIQDFIGECRGSYFTMFDRELRRRFAKLQDYAGSNGGKNYSSEVQIDFKQAAHLFRVIHSAKSFLENPLDCLRVDFSEIREEYLQIKNGFWSHSRTEILDRFDQMIQPIRQELAQYKDENKEINFFEGNADQVHKLYLWAVRKHMLTNSKGYAKVNS